MQNVTSWLEAIKMEQYAPVFINNGFTTPKDMLELTMEDLNDLCIGPIGHRKKILKAVKHTRHQVKAFVYRIFFHYSLVFFYFI